MDEWLQSNGDARGGGGPGDARTGNFQMLDWIELIPFTETRNYVQRVLENVVVYRALAGVAAPHPLAPYLR